MRRLTIPLPFGHTAEAAQFTNGVIGAFWPDPPHPYMWRDLDASREDPPDAALYWIDPDPKEPTRA